MKVALLGCGWIQDFHARGVLAHGDELVAVANHREETARTFADRYQRFRAEFRFLAQPRAQSATENHNFHAWRVN